MPLRLTSLAALAAVALAGAGAGAGAAKVCPEQQPTPFTECDNQMYRNGLSADDPVCAYDACPDDGTMVCGCVDTAALGQPDGKVLWQCMRGSCECPADQASLDSVDCKVKGSDYGNASFVGPFSLDDKACGVDNDCSCRPSYGDGELFGAWHWECSPAAAPAAPAAVAGAAAVASLVWLASSSF